MNALFRRFAITAILAAVLSAGGGFAFGFYKEKAAASCLAAYFWSSFHDQHALAVALGAWPETAWPSEGDFLVALSRIRSEARRFRVRAFLPKNASVRWADLERRIDAFLRDSAVEGEAPPFLFELVPGHGRATAEAVADYLRDCRNAERFRAVFDSPSGYCGTFRAMADRMSCYSDAVERLMRHSDELSFREVVRGDGSRYTEFWLREDGGPGTGPVDPDPESRETHSFQGEAAGRNDAEPEGYSLRDYLSGLSRHGWCATLLFETNGVLSLDLPGKPEFF